MPKQNQAYRLPTTAMTRFSAWFVAMLTILLTGLFWYGVKDLLFAWELDSLTIRQRLFSLPPKDRSAVTPIALITYDNKTLGSSTFLKILGDPPSRIAPAYVARFLRRTQTRSVLFDMSFNGGIHYQDLAGDQAMADSTQGHRAIASTLIFSQEADPSLSFRGQDSKTQLALARNSVQVRGINAFPIYAQVYQFPSLVPPYPALLDSSMQFYAANASIFKASLESHNADFSSDSRRWTPFALYDGHIFPTAALGVASMSNREFTLHPDGALTWENGRVHLGPDGLPLIKWYGHGVIPDRPVYPETSFLDVVFSEIVLECRENPAQPVCKTPGLPKKMTVHPEQFRNKYVLIGMTLPNSGDTHKTIYSGHYFGLYILANILDNVLHDDFVHPAPFWVQVLFFLLLPGLLAVAGLRYKSVPVIGLLMIGLALGYFSFCASVYNELNLWIYAVYPILGLIVCFAGLFIYRFLKEQKQRQQLRFAFGKYVSPAVMELIEKNPAMLRLGGERREMSFLFSDIRGFTTFSDQNPPEIVQQYLTDYFSIMNSIILNRFHGSINKLIGDAIMAYWGFPLESEDHAFLAVSAAMAMRDALDEWRQNPDKPPINIGIGINTGEAVIGNVGSEDFMDFTVIGDAVNVASRLESLNKEHGTNIIISANTYARIKDRIAARSLGFVQIRGKQATMELFEPLHHLSDTVTQTH